MLEPIPDISGSCGGVHLDTHRADILYIELEYPERMQREENMQSPNRKVPGRHVKSEISLSWSES